jgi:hypothetical protein
MQPPFLIFRSSQYLQTGYKDLISRLCIAKVLTLFEVTLVRKSLHLVANASSRSLGTELAVHATMMAGF